MSAREIVLPAGADREEWLAVRSRGIGGSDVAVILGLSKFKSPWQLWAEKVGIAPSDEAGEAAYWGHVLEPVVADEYAKRTGHKVFDTPGTVQHSEIPWMLVNPDRLVCDQDHEDCEGCALLEIKTTSAYNADEWAGDSVPYAAALQCQHAMYVLGMERAYVPALIGGQRFVIREVLRDDELIQMILDAEQEFWDRVRYNDPPEIDGSESTTKLLSRMFDVEPEATTELPESVYDLIALRKAAKEAEAQAKNEADRYANEVRQLMGSAELGLCNNEPIATWKANAKGVRVLNFKKGITA